MTSGIQRRLFTNEYPKRPGYFDEIVTKRAAEFLLPYVVEWLGDEANDRVLPNLIEAMRYCDEGYELAKALEHRGWSPDSELVEILDNAAHKRYEAHNEVMATWVKSHDLKLE